MSTPEESSSQEPEVSLEFSTMFPKYLLKVSFSCQTNPRELEKLEEEKLKAKYPTTTGLRGPGGHSAFLQKRLQKGVSIFVEFQPLVFSFC